ncbi:MAG: hypothetical protein HY996_00600 [Micrococcales bacterium]|nr:hypothetical protein [Micrococcales bacterium]
MSIPPAAHWWARHATRDLFFLFDIGSDVRLLGVYEGAALLFVDRADDPDPDPPDEPPGE